MTKRYCDRAMSWCAYHNTVHATSEFHWHRSQGRWQSYCRRANKERTQRERRMRWARRVIKAVCS